MRKSRIFSPISSSESGRRLALTRRALLVAGAAVVLGCGDSKASSPPKANEYFYDCERSPAAVQNFATDESFVEFINKEVALGLEVDDTQAPLLESPTPGSTISASAPPTFSFRVGGTAGRTPARATQAVAARSRRIWASEILGWLLLERVAHAHCAPVSGDNYLFRLVAKGNTTPIYTAQLSVTTFAPSVEAWSQALRGHVGKVVTLSLARAVYSGGSITNGPFVAAAPLEFTVSP